MQAKLEKLKYRLRQMNSVLLAYSGGADSSFLLKVSKEVLKDKVLAVTALSETYTAGELESAKTFAKTLGAKHRILRTYELTDPKFWKNPLNRCYYCKKELFSRLQDLARKKKINFVIDGSNVDDLCDYRPGAQAKKEFGVISPLQDAGLTKKEIRLLSRKLGLLTWSKPAMACLASRIPYHSRITRKRLERIGQAEEVLRKRFQIRGNLRVRDFKDLARIEVDKKEIKKLKSPEKLRVLFEALGYKNVVIDPQGYRSGSLNEAINWE